MTCPVCRFVEVAMIASPTGRTGLDTLPFPIRFQPNGLFASFPLQRNFASIKFKQLRRIATRLVKRAILTSSLHTVQVVSGIYCLTGNDDSKQKKKQRP